MFPPPAPPVTTPPSSAPSPAWWGPRPRTRSGNRGRGRGSGGSSTPTYYRWTHCLTPVFGDGKYYRTTWEVTVRLPSTRNFYQRILQTMAGEVVNTKLEVWLREFPPSPDYAAYCESCLVSAGKSESGKIFLRCSQTQVRGQGWVTFQCVVCDVTQINQQERPVWFSSITPIHDTRTMASRIIVKHLMMEIWKYI